jgi:hypothetical protein
MKPLNWFSGEESTQRKMPIGKVGSRLLEAVAFDSSEKSYRES